MDDVRDLGGAETFGYKIKSQVYRYPKPIIHRGDTMWCYLLPEVWVYPPLKFKSEKQRKAYNKLVYNVKKVLPLAQRVNGMAVLYPAAVRISHPFPQMEEKYAKFAYCSRYVFSAASERLRRPRRTRC